MENILMISIYVFCSIYIIDDVPFDLCIQSQYVREDFVAYVEKSEKAGNELPPLKYLYSAFLFYHKGCTLDDVCLGKKLFSFSKPEPDWRNISHYSRILHDIPWTYSIVTSIDKLRIVRFDCDVSAATSSIVKPTA